MDLISKPNLQPAVFLDRDGTIIEDLGDLNHPSQVVFYDDTISTLRRLQKHFSLFIVTNQSGISKGTLNHTGVESVNKYVTSHLAKAGVKIVETYVCHHSRADGCSCIKPNPFFLLKAEKEHRIDLKRSFVIGDHPHDVILADNVGAEGVYVLTGHGSKHRKDLTPGKTIVPGIREAGSWILACFEMQRQKQENSGLFDNAAKILRNGGIVAFPTETVYGLGAAVFNEKAVAKIFEVKQRPSFDPLIVHVGSVEQLPLLTKNVPTAAQTVIEHFWPGPLTVVLPKLPQVPDLVTAGLANVAVRMPRHPAAMELIRKAELPLAAPSANLFGYTSPTTAQHVFDQLAEKVDFIIDGGACHIGVESTIVSFTDDSPMLLRPGGLPLEEIEALIGPLRKNTSSAVLPVTAPGMLPRHYAPHTRLKVVSDFKDFTPPSDKKVGVLALRKIDKQESFESVEILSETGDLREAAANLFGAMRRLDENGLDIIIAETVPNTGLGLAINDRLSRAAGTC
ncbi:MAG: L-threonylcarbamoyladenylate synthase [Phycisphaerae bacterium]